MDVCHILLGRPWQYDIAKIHEGKSNCYKFEKDGIMHIVLPLQEGKTSGTRNSKNLLLGGKEYLQKIEEKEVSFSIIYKPKVELTNTSIVDLPQEVQNMLQEFSYIIVDDIPNELPPKKSISHHIDLVSSANFPNKVSYRMTPQEMKKLGGKYKAC